MKRMPGSQSKVEQLTASELDRMQKAGGFWRTRMAYLSPPKKRCTTKPSPAAQHRNRAGLAQIAPDPGPAATHRRQGRWHNLRSQETAISATNVDRYFRHSIIDSSGHAERNFQALIRFLHNCSNSSHPGPAEPGSLATDCLAAHLQGNARATCSLGRLQSVPRLVRMASSHISAQAAIRRDIATPRCALLPSSWHLCGMTATVAASGLCARQNLLKCQNLQTPCRRPQRNKPLTGTIAELTCRRHCIPLPPQDTQENQHGRNPDPL